MDKKDVVLPLMSPMPNPIKVQDKQSMLKLEQELEKCNRLLMTNVTGVKTIDVGQINA